jgi:choline dehydrogenase-like flavoprotein
MGREEDEMACVDSSFRLFGVEGLRVADLSTLPFLFNCHPVAVAYQVGEAAAEKIIGEYELDG